MTMVLIYLVKGFVHMPQSIQDFVYQLLSTSGPGYVGVLLIKLYRIHPGLPVLIVIIVSVIIHLVIKSGQEKDRYGRLKSIVPLPSDTPTSKLPIKDSKSIQQTQLSNNSNASHHITRRQSVISAIKISELLVDELNNNSNNNKIIMSCDSEERKSDFHNSLENNDILSVSFISNGSSGEYLSELSYVSEGDNSSESSILSDSTELSSSSESSEGSLNATGSDDSDDIASMNDDDFSAGDGIEYNISDDSSNVSDMGCDAMSI
jgi:hypothetical protein